MPSVLSPHSNRLHEAVTHLHRLLPGPVDAAVVLGSGLDAFATSFPPETEVAIGTVPGWPGTAVPGHSGRIRTVLLSGRRVLVFRGRPHMYEGHDAPHASAPAVFAAAAGARVFVSTSAAGGLHPLLRTGDLFLHTDLLPSPLAPGMGAALRHAEGDARRLFDTDLQVRARAAARALRQPLREGVFAFCAGPTYETRAEIGMLRRLGADAVGMSTAPELLAASRAGLAVLALSCITNTASTVPRRVSHDDVTTVAAAGAAGLAALLTGILGEM